MEEEIKELIDRDPPVAFEIVMSSGQKYRVTPRHRVDVLKAGVLLVHPDSDRYDLLRKSQIAAVEFLGIEGADDGR